MSQMMGHIREMGQILGQICEMGQMGQMREMGRVSAMGPRIWGRRAGPETAAGAGLEMYAAGGGSVAAGGPAAASPATAAPPAAPALGEEFYRFLALSAVYDLCSLTRAGGEPAQGLEEGLTAAFDDMRPKMGDAAADRMHDLLGHRRFGSVRDALRGAVAEPGPVFMAASGLLDLLLADRAATRAEAQAICLQLDGGLRGQGQAVGDAPAVVAGLEAGSLDAFEREFRRYHDSALGRLRGEGRGGWALGGAAVAALGRVLFG
jgi:hypothetical protein